jgi:hypothetical protein
MEEIVREWQSMVEGIRAVTDKIEKIVEAMDRDEKSEAAKKSEAPAKAPAKWVVKKGVEAMPIDSVLNAIYERGKGIDIADLIVITGLSEKEIRRAIFILRKEGKVKRLFVAND